MLDQMIESRNHNNDNQRRGRLLLGTFMLAAAVLASGWTYSLFAKSIALGDGEIDMSSLVAPVAIPEEAPAPAPEPKAQPNSPASPSKKITLTQIVDEVRPTNDPPKDTSGQANVVSARKFNQNDIQLGIRNEIPDNAASSDGSSNGGGRGCSVNCGGGGVELSTAKNDGPEEKEPEVKATPKPEPPKKVSLGVINGKALNLVKPTYPAAARLVRADGAVNVQVTVDETGNVVSATALSGHPLLRNAAETAARQAKFSPTYLSKVAVKVTGVIVYNFQL